MTALPLADYELALGVEDEDADSDSRVHVGIFFGNRVYLEKEVHMYEDVFKF
jgi:hypothetical protein